MTFSIVVRDPATGAFGVATATGGPAVGSLVPHARAGVGAVATQSSTNPHFAIQGLDLLARLKDATKVLPLLVAADPERERRQCVMIGTEGPPAAFTGADATPESGDFLEEDFAVAGNMLSSVDVLAALHATFRNAGDGPLEDRLLAALKAAETAGGDYRGTRSAALKVYRDALYPVVDLRVDWSMTPVDDLAPILAATRDETYAKFFKTLPKPLKI